MARTRAVKRRSKSRGGRSRRALAAHSQPPRPGPRRRASFRARAGRDHGRLCGQGSANGGHMAGAGAGGWGRQGRARRRAGGHEGMGRPKPRRPAWPSCRHVCVRAYESKSTQKHAHVFAPAPIFWAKRAGPPDRAPPAAGPPLPRRRPRRRLRLGPLPCAVPTLTRAGCRWGWPPLGGGQVGRAGGVGVGRVESGEG
jgi:hypothetical protein